MFCGTSFCEQAHKPASTPKRAIPQIVLRPIEFRGQGRRFLIGCPLLSTRMRLHWRGLGAAVCLILILYVASLGPFLALSRKGWRPGVIVRAYALPGKALSHIPASAVWLIFMWTFGWNISMCETTRTFLRGFRKARILKYRRGFDTHRQIVNN